MARVRTGAWMSGGWGTVARAIAIGLAMGAGVAGCADTLPAEDLRITEATPVAKLSVALIWKDHQDDPVSARASYWGKAVEVSGIVTRMSEPTVPEPHVMFVQQDEHGVLARLLSDRAAQILAAAKVGERLTLKCFCDQMVEGDLVLKSCVRP